MNVLLKYFFILLINRHKYYVKDFNTIIQNKTNKEFLDKSNTFSTNYQIYLIVSSIFFHTCSPTGATRTEF